MSTEEKSQVENICSNLMEMNEEQLGIAFAYTEGLKAGLKLAMHKQQLEEGLSA